MRSLFKSILLLISMWPLSQAMAQPIKCAQLFADSQNKKQKVDYVGVSLFYSPALLINGKSSIQNYQVFIESYLPNSNQPVHQSLAYYMNPVTGLSEVYGRGQYHEAGLKAIYNSYGDRVDPRIVEKVIAAESQLSLDRQATFVAKDRETKEAYGFMRIFDGSIYKSGLRSTTSTQLPLEIILKSMGKDTYAVEEKRQQGKALFEIGKYFIKDHLDPVDTRHIKSDILKWLVKYLETRGAEELADSYYFAHVASATHRIAYQRFFGFETVEKNKSEGLGEGEDLLIINGKTLLDNMEKRIAEMEASKP